MNRQHARAVTLARRRGMSNAYIALLLANTPAVRATRTARAARNARRTIQARQLARNRAHAVKKAVFHPKHVEAMIKKYGFNWINHVLLNKPSRQ
jgi:hypothetical protein